MNAMIDDIPSFRGENLTKAFDGVQALAGVSVEFPRSGIVAIIGPNGAGKTTLLNVLTGFLKPNGGRFFLGPDELTRLPPHQIARQGITRTFQDLRLITLVPAIENVLFARPHQKGENILRALLRFGVAREETKNWEAALHWLRFVGLEDKAHEPAGELSYGQQKLLALACCLASEARILLLDEPVAGVHPGMIAKILDLLRQLKDSGKLVVFVEHDLAAVREVADHAIVMDDGKIIAEGPPDELLARPEIINCYTT